MDESPTESIRRGSLLHRDSGDIAAHHSVCGFDHQRNAVAGGCILWNRNVDLKNAGEPRRLSSEGDRRGHAADQHGGHRVGVADAVRGRARSAAVRTTERYLGTRQDLVNAPNDGIKLRVDR